MYRLLFVLSLCFAFQATSLTAQVTAKGISAGMELDLSANELSINDWSIFSDQDNQLYFIDFEQLAVNLNEVVVKDEAGHILWQEQVFDLPVNTIYELDFSQYQTGQYVIELRAYTGVIRKAVRHQRS